tara:strand:- start:1300 stop:3252 length:1953 start_codon:yes stop_codon:yes gene_type:complete
MNNQQYITIPQSGGGGGGFTINTSVSTTSPDAYDTITISVTSGSATLTGADWYLDGQHVFSGLSGSFNILQDMELPHLGDMDLVCVATDGSGFASSTTAIEARPRYDRPSDWLNIDSLVTVSDEKIVALIAVIEDSDNLVALRCQGAYTVDWGDGTVTNYASNTIASHSYAYSGVSPGNFSTRGYGMQILTVTPQAGQSLTTFRTDVTHPSTVGSQSYNYLDIRFSLPNCTTFDHDGNSVQQNKNMLERIIGLGTWGVTNLTTACRGLPALVECELPAATGPHQALFQNCTDLQVVSNMNFNGASGANSLRSLFNNCVKLQYVPDIDAPNAIVIQETFRGTFNLLGVGTFKVPSATNSTNWVFQSRLRILYGEYNFDGLVAANQMFQDTNKLVSAPPLSFPSLTNATQLFVNCGIQGLDVDLPVATAGRGIFQGFSGTIKRANMPALVNADRLFRGCLAQDSSNVTVGGAGTITNAGAMFFGSYFDTIPAVDYSNVVTARNNEGIFEGTRARFISGSIDLSSLSNNAHEMFSQAINLKEINATSIGTDTDGRNLFSSAANVQEIGSFSLGNVTNLTGAFNNMRNLQRMKATGIKATVDFSSCGSLSADAIDEIFTNLATVSSGTINVSNNNGSSSCTTSIATTKGWTVVT